MYLCTGDLFALRILSTIFLENNIISIDHSYHSYVPLGMEYQELVPILHPIYVVDICFKSLKFTFMATNLQNNPLELAPVSCILNPCNKIGENHIDMIVF